ncbi:TetR/AcrR family transcriptional regulator [Subtercola vilae]|uniref:TetR/AcrR family transcriptional regulator n=1 Tax=Subtercola vilae TaxID=2056433 RepID=A0A4T2CAC0_9MICO|nr:TetR/AcrR family transcriptional regulator [Subtercola vilae]
MLHAARRRFARDGYSATTVRDIAADAGVNVALISRYFVSKEGLFEACLARVGEELRRPDTEPATIENIITTMISQIADSPNGEQALQLLLLLRSSGDEAADLIRQNTLASFAERMALATGCSTSAAPADHLLRAQLAIAAVMGVVLMRTSTGLEPLSSATAEDLHTPMTELLSALLKH